VSDAVDAEQFGNKMKLIFATNNQHKIEEMQAAIGSKIELVSLKQAGIDVEIPEPFDTLEENATAKSKFIYELTGKNCFSEDTGLEVESLNGEPGVKSARYAGENRSFEENIQKLLSKLEGVSNRKARFRAVISLVIGGKENQFEGICEGKIIDYKRGNQGFGYDPVFIPEGSDKTFAEMEVGEKNKFNHRRKAADKLVAFLDK
jgi:XTP/dITP diphosphohydrolase